MFLLIMKNKIDVYLSNSSGNINKDSGVVTPGEAGVREGGVELWANIGAGADSEP